MKLGNIDVQLVKGKQKNIQCNLVFYNYYCKLKRIKRPPSLFLKDKFFGAKSVILVNFNKNDNQEVVRKSVANCFRQINKNNIEVVGFLVDSFNNYFDLRIFLKIVAQELFRYGKTDKKQNLKEVVFITNSESKYKVANKNIISYLNHLKINKGPFLTVDGIILYKKGVVLVERKNPPLGWALPGGFVDYGESVEKAVAREVKEETGLDFKNIKQFKVYSKTSRDPRFHTVSVVFSGRGKGKLQAASDAKSAAIFKIENKKTLAGLPPNIAFDHKKIIKDYLNKS